MTDLERLDKLAAGMLKKMNEVMVEALDMLAGGWWRHDCLIFVLYERTGFPEHGIKGSLRLLVDIGLIERGAGLTENPDDESTAIVRLRKQPEPPAPSLCKFGPGGDFTTEYEG